jgi:hypothetical protein
MFDDLEWKGNGEHASFEDECVRRERTPDDCLSFECGGSCWIRGDDAGMVQDWRGSEDGCGR